MSVNVTIDYERIAAFCRHWHVAELALFGSVLRDDFDPARSDIDVLVQFLPGHQVGLIGLMAMQEELARMFGRRVDLMTPQGVAPEVRRRIIESARVVYGAA